MVCPTPFHEEIISISLLSCTPQTSQQKPNHPFSLSWFNLCDSLSLGVLLWGIGDGESCCRDCQKMLADWNCTRGFSCNVPGGSDCFNFSTFSESFKTRVYRCRWHRTLNLTCDDFLLRLMRAARYPISLFLPIPRYPLLHIFSLTPRLRTASEPYLVAGKNVHEASLRLAISMNYSWYKLVSMSLNRAQALQNLRIQRADSRSWYLKFREAFWRILTVVYVELTFACGSYKLTMFMGEISSVGCLVMWTRLSR